MPFKVCKFLLSLSLSLSLSLCVIASRFPASAPKKLQLRTDQENLYNVVHLRVTHESIKREIFLLVVKWKLHRSTHTLLIVFRDYIICSQCFSERKREFHLFWRCKYIQHWNIPLRVTILIVTSRANQPLP